MFYYESALKVWLLKKHLRIYGLISRYYKLSTNQIALYILENLGSQTFDIRYYTTKWFQIGNEDSITTKLMIIWTSDLKDNIFIWLTT